MYIFGVLTFLGLLQQSNSATIICPGGSAPETLGSAGLCCTQPSAVGQPGCSFTAGSQVVFCQYSPGTSTAFVVPAFVTELNGVLLNGAAGGTALDAMGSPIGGFTDGPGGIGASLVGYLPVTSGDTLYATVGVAGDTSTDNNIAYGPTFGGGGGAIRSTGAFSGKPGGGATDLRLNGMALSNRIAIAGGGGGAGAGGEAGGDAAYPNAQDGRTQYVQANGGSGNGGMGATQTAPGLSPVPGSLGQGGTGDRSGGGGGGGLYGGAGGDTIYPGRGGGGGGGSSFVPVTGTWTVTTTTSPASLSFAYNRCQAPATVSMRARARKRSQTPMALCPANLKPCYLPSGDFECVEKFEACEA